MEKKFSKSEIATIKRIAQNVAPFIAKRNKIQKQLEEKKETVEQQVREMVAKRLEKLEAKAEEEIKNYQTIIDSLQSYVVNLTGYCVEDLVTRKTEGTGKIDSNTGKEVMRTIFTLKYPETVIPAMEMPEHGNDYDIDAQQAEAEAIQEEVLAAEDFNNEDSAARESASEPDPFNWD